MAKIVPVDEELPPPKTPVQVVTASGMVSTLVYDHKSRLWFLPDMKMYVYYTPIAWLKEDS